MFNAIAVELQGLLDGTSKLLDVERKDSLKATRRQQRQLDARRARTWSRWRLTGCACIRNARQSFVTPHIAMAWR
ncbi:hypothetical protein J8I87_31940 [Paraburkholderia sp. LEh10]|uniref:hypothetical protein n=1 Tax=Paraburkholderia sp. LEh10 TaxID=2821353 RepID=UPI001AE69100|nr:hypothetical protein [Paraburkholderia sp. LEh10]MBP0594200.1 hypothetical protein [Paraburkholderia sp. LEh10]